MAETSYAKCRNLSVKWEFSKIAPYFTLSGVGQEYPSWDKVQTTDIL